MKDNTISIMSWLYVNVFNLGVEDVIEDISCFPLSWDISGSTQIAILTATSTVSSVVLAKLPNDMAQDKEGNAFLVQA